MLAVKEVIRVTPAALEVVREVLADEAEPEGLALWLEVNGSANGVYTYDLWFGSKSKIRPGDDRATRGRHHDCDTGPERGTRSVVPCWT